MKPSVQRPRNTLNEPISKMAKSRELTIEQRARVKALSDAGWSYRTIAKELKCSLSTVSYILNKIKTNNYCPNR